MGGGYCRREGTVGGRVGGGTVGGRVGGGYCRKGAGGHGWTMRRKILRSTLGWDFTVSGREGRRGMRWDDESMLF